MSARNSAENLIENPEWEWLWQRLLAPRDWDNDERVDIVSVDISGDSARKLHLITSEREGNARD